MSGINICIKSRAPVVNLTSILLKTQHKMMGKQVCIPVGCVPPACGSSHQLGVCLSACWDTPPPQCGTGDPPGCGSGDHPDHAHQPPPGWGLETPLARPLNFPPPRCGPRDPPWPDPSSSPWVWAWTCKACWDTTPSPHPPPHCGQNS